MSRRVVKLVIPDLIRNPGVYVFTEKKYIFHHATAWKQEVGQCMEQLPRGSLSHIPVLRNIHTSSTSHGGHRGFVN